MRVSRDKGKQCVAAKATRYYIAAWSEYKAGLVARKIIRKDDTGQVFETRGAAEAYANKLRQQIDAGGNPANAAGRTFGDALDRYHANLDGRQADGLGSPNHYDAVRARLNTFVRSLTLRGVKIAAVQLNAIDVDLVEQDLVPQLRDEKYTRNFQRLLKQDVDKIFQFAVAAKWITSNPIANVTFGAVKTKSRERSGIDPLAREVYQRLLKSFSLHLDWARRLDPSAVLPIQIAAQTGVRAGELCAIAPSQIGHNTKQLTIDRAWKKHERRQPKVLGLTKTHETRVVGLTSDLIGRLDQHRQDNAVEHDATLFATTDHAPWRRAWQRAQFAVAGWLLLYSGSKTKSYRLFELAGNETDAEIAKLRSWSDGQIGKAKNCTRDDGVVFNTLAAAAAHAGITLLTWHDLRHLYCSVLFHAELPIERITALLGHANDEVTRGHYKEWITNPARDADEALRVASAFG